MSDQFSVLLKIAAVTILFTLLWAVLVAFTYWDTHNQRLPARKAFLWLALVALLPFIGFIAYLFFRVFSMLYSSRTNQSEPAARRVTALKPPAGWRKVMPTINASDVDMQIVRDAETALQANVNPQKIAATYAFTISSGADLDKEFIVVNLPARIGRGSEASIRLDKDLGVSRKHAEIYEQGGFLRLRDLKSVHGTQLNGIRIDDKSLESGDRIQIGSTILVVKIIKEH
jgi:pSer/pThr/pTyr-binding forkhead associated (FHA) protein